MKKDSQGQELSVGDTVVFIRNGYRTGATMHIGKIVEFRKKIKVEPYGSWLGVLAGEAYFWTEPSRCVKVLALPGLNV